MGFVAGFKKTAEDESNKDMVEIDATSIERKARYLSDLINKLSDSEDCPPWVVSKISQAKTHVQDVMDYIASSKTRRESKGVSKTAGRTWTKKEYQVPKANTLGGKSSAKLKPITD